MAYTNLSFVPGEILTAAKMNLLAANDASLRDGTGIGDSAIQPRHVSKNGINKILCAESPYRDLNIQYASVESGQISITKPGDYLLMASFQQQTWKNGTGADVALSIYKNSSVVDRAIFNTPNWHFGFVQKKVSLVAGDKIECAAQVQQAVSMSISARISAIPISVLG